IEAGIAAALSAQYALGPAKDVTLAFDRELRALAVEPSTKGEPRVTRVSYDASTARFDATLEIPGRAPFRLSGRAQPTIEVATVAHAVARGEVLKQADVVMERRPRNIALRDAVTDRDQAVGLAARNGLQPGQALRAADLMKPEIVQRNEMV